MKVDKRLFILLLADCTNSRAHARVSRASVYNVCIVAKQCVLPKKMAEESNRKLPGHIEWSHDE